MMVPSCSSRAQVLRTLHMHTHYIHIYIFTSWIPHAVWHNFGYNKSGRAHLLITTVNVCVPPGFTSPATTQPSASKSRSNFSRYRRDSNNQTQTHHQFHIQKSFTFLMYCDGSCSLYMHEHNQLSSVGGWEIAKPPKTTK